MTNLNRWKKLCALFLLYLPCAATAIAVPTTTFTNLINFDNTNGAFPDFMSLVQGTDGNYYGTTSGGGSSSLGTVFKISPSGTLTTVYSFCIKTGCTDGSNPQTGLVQSTDGNFYGTTLQGGTSDYGTVFKITRGGVLTTLHSFDGTDGASPLGRLVRATNGDFYGTTSFGGDGYGTVFKITSAGTLTTLHIFMGFPAGDGGNPYGGLMQATNGNLYGTTFAGGVPNVGTFYQMTLAGALDILYVFSSIGDGGANPYGTLVQAANGNLYGTAAANGANADGTVFRITTSGVLTTLHSFDGTDGANPEAGLVLGSDGNFYGTTNAGGTNSEGTIFKITSAGTLKTLHDFDGTDGRNPCGGLMQATSGTFYGTTYEGGTGSDTDGTAFSLSTGLAAFVETQTPSGAVGASIVILGSDLTGASAVTFNGKAAAFTVSSSTEIKATVPSGATSGTVKVTTPSGVLKSNVAFQVTP